MDDNDKGELVKFPPSIISMKKKHSEAERRRRHRINAHLATLRGLLPSTVNNKMNKATLLGEVVKQVKELKKNAEEASKGFLIPMDSNEVKVEATEEGDGSSMSYRATVSCEYRPDLLSDLRQTFDGLQLQLVSAQVSTLGDRVKNEVVYTCYCKGDMMSSVEACQVLARNLHQSLSSLLTSHPIHNTRLCCLQTSVASSCYN